MNYALLILRRAQKDLARLEKIDYRRVVDAISLLGDNPRPGSCKKLAGRDGWRIRVGNHRVIYEIDDRNHTVTILHIGHRRDIYS